MVVSYRFKSVLETSTVNSTLYDKYRHLTRFHDSNRPSGARWEPYIRETLTSEYECDVIPKDPEVTKIGTKKAETSASFDIHVNVHGLWWIKQRNHKVSDQFNDFTSIFDSHIFKEKSNAHVKVLSTDFKEYNEVYSQYGYFKKYYLVKIEVKSNILMYGISKNKRNPNWYNSWAGIKPDHHDLCFLILDYPMELKVFTFLNLNKFKSKSINSRIRGKTEDDQKKAMKSICAFCATSDDMSELLHLPLEK